MSGYEELLALADAATPGPWGYNGYSAVYSAEMVRADDEFWSDERLNDGHTYDRRVGQTCPTCGERPAIYGDDALPEFRGKRFGTYWDCALSKDAYDVEPCVASVPAQYGDTATGRHAADAAFIAAANPTAVKALVEEVLALRGKVERVEAQHEPSTDHYDGYEPYCVGYWEAGGMDGAPSWPCPTIRALGDDQ